MSQPLFFQKLDDFIQQLPVIDSQASLQDYSIRSFESASAAVQSYITFYQANYFDLAAAYTIARSEIAGFRVVEHYWQAQKPNGKTLYLCHGYLDHTGLYPRLIRWGLARGYHIHSFDLPGHGLSAGEPAAIDSFDQYSEVLLQIINRQQVDEFILVGQSTGCAVIANAMLQPQTFAFNKPPEDTVLLAPLLRSRGWGLMRYLYHVLKYFKHSIKRAEHAAGHDHEFNEFVDNKDPLQASKIPLSWLGAMDQWYKRLRKDSHPLLTPQKDAKVLIVQGDADSVVDFKYNLPRLQHYLPSSTIHWINGAEHRLANESDAFWRKVEDCLNDYFA